MDIQTSAAVFDPTIWHAAQDDPPGFARKIEEHAEQEAVFILLSHQPGISREMGKQIRHNYTRAALATLLGVKADAITITCDKSGCPLVISEGKKSGWNVSFSARGCFSFIGLSRLMVGVDLDVLHPVSAIPWAILREDERTYLLDLPESARFSHFLSLWCRKEAVVKALGTGFVLPPEAITIPFVHQPNRLSLTIPSFGAIHNVMLMETALRLTTIYKPAFNMLGAEGEGEGLKSVLRGNFSEETLSNVRSKLPLLISACLIPLQTPVTAQNPPEERLWKA